MKSPSRQGEKEPLAKDMLRRQLRFQGVIDDLPIAEAEAVQLGRGKAHFMALRFCGRDIILTRLNLEPRFCGHVVPNPEWICLMVPLRWQGDYVFNGMVARPHDVFVAAGPNGYASTGKARDTLAVGIRRSRIDATMTALCGKPAEPFWLVDQRLPLLSRHGSRFRQDLIAAMRCAMSSPVDDYRFALSETAESDLFVLIGKFLVDHLGEENVCDTCRVDALRVVRTAQRALEEQHAHQASLADLCAASGVSQTWLHKCFVDIYGTSPYRYLRSRRLSAARDSLLDKANRAASVKAVALTYGFANFGRFAADYRARFGENPSETLLARHLIPDDRHQPWYLRPDPPIWSAT